jgi:hypothetical protein
MQRGNTYLMQESRSAFDDGLHFSAWQHWTPNQPTQGYLNELFASPNILPDGSHLPVLQRPVSAYQTNQLPLLLTPTHKLPSTKQKSLPKLLPTPANRTVSRPIVVSWHDDRWLAGLLRQLKTKSWHCTTAKHRGILEDLLGNKEASWTLAFITLPPRPGDVALNHPGLEATATTIVHIGGTIVFVDLVESQKVCFKLTEETIETLLDYYEKVHCPAITANMVNDSATDANVLVLKERFRQALEEFFFYTGKGCLMSTEDDGSGELCCTQPAKVKLAILALFKYPPPRPKFSIGEDTSPSEAIGKSWSDVNKNGELLASEEFWQPSVDMDIDLGL